MDEKRRLMQEDIAKKKEESAKKGSPIKEHRAAVEANRMEVREKVAIKLQ